MKADEILKEWGAFFKERNNEDYGELHLQFGKTMETLFPDGITLKGEDDFYYFHLLIFEVAKISRITHAMAQGRHHPDSWKDLAVYAAMYMAKFQTEQSCQ